MRKGKTKAKEGKRNETFSEIEDESVIEEEEEEEDLVLLLIFFLSLLQSIEKQREIAWCQRISFFFSGGMSRLKPSFFPRTDFGEAPPGYVPGKTSDFFSLSRFVFSLFSSFPSFSLFFLPLKIY
jgi:hypothetical protein